MKISPLKYARLTGLGVACLVLVTGGLHAKPDKGGGQGKGKGGGSSAQGKGNPGKGPGKPGKGPGNADKPGKGPGGGKGNADRGGGPGKTDFKAAEKELRKIDKEDAKWRAKRFRDDDRDSVITYFSQYRDREHGLPPGLAKNLARGKPLPPGWQKKVAPGYIIEDDYRDSFHPLSYDTFPRLERVPDTRLYRYGDRVVRVYEPRREVIDVIVVPTIRP